MNLDRL